MEIVHSDEVFRVDGGPPDYNRSNPLLALMELIEASLPAIGLEHYVPQSLQYLFPFRHLELYGPSGGDAGVLDPADQDVKTDFQKQNVRRFLTADTQVVRGLATAGSWTGPFVRVSYRGGPDSALARAAEALGPWIKLWIKIGDRTSPTLIPVPYNHATGRYEIELWGYPGDDLIRHLDEVDRGTLESGALLVRPDLVAGGASDFTREALGERLAVDVAPDHALHPILPLRVELAWADYEERAWDSLGGANHQYEFSMIVRGWENFLTAGGSPNPHGGVGFLEYRNLLSNYFRHAERNELGRTVEPWNFGAFGNKLPESRFEPFFAVDYMDLHVLKGSCGIGLHRHRDNQEVFLMLDGHAYMVVGDWCKMPSRERCFEVRMLRSGHLAMLKGGQLHGLMNPMDEDVSLFMFGGYD